MNIKTEINTAIRFKDILHHIFHNFNKKLKKITNFLVKNMYLF